MSSNQNHSNSSSNSNKSGSGNSGNSSKQNDSINNQLFLNNPSQNGNSGSQGGSSSSSSQHPSSQSTQRTDSFSDLIHKIQDSLGGNSELVEKFHQLLENSDDYQSDPDALFNQIIELVGGNEKLKADLERKADEYNDDPVAVLTFSSLVNEINANLKAQPSILQLFTHAVALFVNQLISLDFFEYRIRQLTTQLASITRRKIEQRLSKFTLKIKISDESAFYRVVRNDILKDVNEEFVLDPSYIPSLMTQIMVMSGCSCNVEQLNVVLRALKIYSSELLPIDGIYHWIYPINPVIAQAFEEAAQKERIDMFYPTTIFESMKKDFSAEQLKWSLGENLYNILNDMQNDKPPSLLQLALKYKEDNKKLKDRNEAVVPPYIVEMKCLKMYRAIKITADHLRSDNYNSSPQIPLSIIQSIFGPSKFEQSDAYYSILIQKCIEIGQEASKKEVFFLEQKLATYIPSSIDWRCIFKTKVSKSYMIHSLFFNGRSYSIENMETMRISANTVKKFSHRFTKLDEACDAFLKMLNGGEYELDECAAFAIFCFLELLIMVDEAKNSPNDPDLSKIDDLVWEETSPLAEYDELSIANVDIVLKYFARYLHLSFKANRSQFESKDFNFASNSIAYHFSSNDNVLSINGYINPVYDLGLP